MDGANLEDFLSRPGQNGFRTLKMSYNVMGEPKITLKDLSMQCKEVPVKWVLPGPRTSKWCISYLSIEGLGLEGHHERFRQICNLRCAGAFSIDHGSWTGAFGRSAGRMQLVEHRSAVPEVADD